MQIIIELATSSVCMCMNACTHGTCILHGLASSIQIQFVSAQLCLKFRVLSIYFFLILYHPLTCSLFVFSHFLLSYLFFLLFYNKINMHAYLPLAVMFKAQKRCTHTPGEPPNSNPAYKLSTFRITNNHSCSYQLLI